MKLLNIEKTSFALYSKYKIRFFGIKFSFKACNSLVLYFKYLIFKKKYNRYIEKNNDGIIRRLIITNGNLNLINSISAINQINSNNRYENSIISCTQARSDFEEAMKKIVKQFDVKNYYSFCNIESKKMITYFINNFLCNFDEIFFTNGHIPFQNLADLFPKSKRYITDEGVCCLYPMYGIDYTKVSGFIWAKYLDKLDRIGTTKGFGQNVVELSKEEFIKTGEKCSKLYPLNIPQNKEDKNIIFLGTYCHGKTSNFYTFEELLSYQLELMKKLTQKGYKVYFKPHPRDLYEYKEDKNFKLLKTTLPLECYPLKENFVAVASVFSSASCQMYHYQGIPGFSSINFLKNAKDDFPTLILEEYTPDIDMLLTVDARFKTFKEVQDELIEKYENWLKNKPLLSENKFLYNKLPNHCKKQNLIDPPPKETKF